MGERAAVNVQNSRLGGPCPSGFRDLSGALRGSRYRDPAAQIRKRWRFDARCPRFAESGNAAQPRERERYWRRRLRQRRRQPARRTRRRYQGYHSHSDLIISSIPWGTSARICADCPGQRPAWSSCNRVSRPGLDWAGTLRALCLRLHHVPCRLPRLDYSPTPEHDRGSRCRRI